MVDYILVFLLLAMVAFAFYLGYERVFRRKGKPESSAYLDALRDLLDGRQESAFTKLRQVVMEDSTNLDAYLRLGQILRENNQPERALQVHKDLALRPGLSLQDKVAILRHLASDSLAASDAKMAEEALRELISLDSSNHWAHTRLLTLLEKDQKWEAAYECAVQILKLEANKSKKPLAKYKYQEGEQLARKREYHKARILYKEAIGLDQTFTGAYLAIGDSYYEENRLDDAVTFWTKLITAVPDQGHLVIDRLQKAFFDLGRFGEIQNICQIILDHAPKNPEARRALAEFYEKKGDMDLAAEMWEQLVDDYPQDHLYLLELIRVYLEKGEKKKISRLFNTLERRRHEKKDRSASDTTTPSAPAGSPS